MTENTINAVRIQKIIDECKDVKTIFFNVKNSTNQNYITPKPGQFAMIWVPGVDEIPMSISGCDDNGNWAITVKNVGECTNAMYKLNIGDLIGVRGPLGNHFKIPTRGVKRIFLVGGGIGMAPLKFLSTQLIKGNIEHTIIEGAKINDDLMYKDNFQELKTYNTKVHYCTDNGSYGTKGVASNVFKKIISKLNKKDHSNSVVYSCGPELMLYKLFKICREYNIEFYASLERIMRCGCGLCGLCAIDPIGILVCRDGPIFNSEILSKMDDFGKYKRNFAGKKINI